MALNQRQEGILVKIGADISQMQAGIVQLEQSLQRVQGGQQKVNQQAQQTTAVMKSARNAYYEAGAALFVYNQAIAALNPLFAQMKQGYMNIIDAGMTFNKMIADSATIVGAHSDDIRTLERELRRMLRTYAIDPKDLGASAYEILSAGITKATSVTKVLDASVKLSIAGLASLDATVDAMTSTLNAYGWSAEKAADVSAIFFKAVEAGKLTFQEMATSIATILPLAAEMDIQLEEVAAQMAAMTQMGFSAGDAFTYNRQLIQALIDPTDAMRQRMAELAEQYNNTALETGKGMIAVFGLQGAYEKLAEGLPLERISQLTSRIQAQQALLATTGDQGKRVRGIMAQMGDGAEKLNSAYEAQNKTLDLLIQRYANLQNLVREAIFNAGVGEYLDYVYKRAIGVAEALEKAVRENNKLATGLAATATAIGVAATYAQTLLDWTFKIGLVLANWKLIAQGLSTVFSYLVNPWKLLLLILAPFKALLAGIVALAQGLMAFLIRAVIHFVLMFNSLGTAFAAANLWLAILLAVGAAIYTYWDKISPLIEDAWQGLKKAAHWAGVKLGIIDPIAERSKEIADEWERTAEAIETIDPQQALITRIATGKTEAGREIYDQLLQEAGNDPQKALDSLKAFNEKIKAQIADLLAESELGPLPKWTLDWIKRLKTASDTLEGVYTRIQSHQNKMPLTLETVNRLMEEQKAKFDPLISYEEHRVELAKLYAERQEYVLSLAKAQNKPISDQIRLLEQQVGLASAVTEAEDRMLRIQAQSDRMQASRAAFRIFGENAPEALTAARSMDAQTLLDTFTAAGKLSEEFKREADPKKLLEMVDAMQKAILSADLLNAKLRIRVTSEEQVTLQLIEQKRQMVQLAAAQAEQKIKPLVDAEKARLDILKPMTERYEFQREVLEDMDKPIRDQLKIRLKEIDIARQQDAIEERLLSLQIQGKEAAFEAAASTAGLTDLLDAEGSIRYDILETLVNSSAESAKMLLSNQLSAEVLNDTSGQWESMYGTLKGAAAEVLVLKETEENRVTNLERATEEYRKQAEEMATIVDFGDLLIESLDASLESLATGKATVKDVFKNFGEAIKAEFTKSFVDILKKKADFDMKWKVNMATDIPSAAADAASSTKGSFLSMFGDLGGGISNLWTSFSDFFSGTKLSASEMETALAGFQDMKFGSWLEAGKVTLDVEGLSPEMATLMDEYAAGFSKMGESTQALNQTLNETNAALAGMTAGIEQAGMTFGQAAGWAGAAWAAGSIIGGVIGGDTGNAVGTGIGFAGAGAAVGAYLAQGTALGASGGGWVGAAIGLIIAGIMIGIQGSGPSVKDMAEKAYEKFFENVTDWKIVKKTGTKIALLDTFNYLDIQTRELIEVFALLSTGVVETELGIRRAYSVALQQLLSGAARADALGKEQGIANLGASLGINSLEDAIDMWMERVNELIRSMDRGGGVRRFTGDDTTISSGIEGFNILVEKGLIPSIERGIQILIDFFGEDLPQAIKNNVPDIIRIAFQNSLENLKRYFNFTAADLPGAPDTGFTFAEALEIAKGNAVATEGMKDAAKKLNWLLDKFIRTGRETREGKFGTTDIRYTEDTGFTRKLSKTIPDLLLLMKEFQAIVLNVDPETGKIRGIDTSGGLNLKDFKWLLGETEDYFNFIAASFRQSVDDIVLAAGDALGVSGDLFDQAVTDLIDQYVKGELTIAEVLQEINDKFGLDLSVSDLNITGEDIVRRLQIESEAFTALANGLAAGTEAWINGATFKDAMNALEDSLSQAMAATANEKLSTAFFKGTNFDNILSIPFQNLETEIEALFTRLKDAQDDAALTGEDVNFDFAGGMSDIMDLLASDFEGVAMSMESLEPVMEAYIEMQERMALAMMTLSQASRLAADYIDAIDLAIAGFTGNEELVAAQQAADKAGERRDEALQRLADAYTIKPIPSGKKTPGADVFNLALGTANIATADNENLKRIIKNLGAAAAAITEAAEAQIAVLEEQLRIAKEWQDLVFEAEDSLRQVRGYGGDDQQQALDLLQQEQARAERLIEQYRTGTDEERLAAAKELTQLGPQLLDIAEKAGYDPGSSVFEAIRGTLTGVLEDIIAEGKVRSESVEDIQAQIRDAQQEAVTQLQSIADLLKVAEEEAERRHLEVAGQEPDWDYIVGPSGPLAETADVAKQTFKRLDEGINTFAVGGYYSGDDRQKDKFKPLGLHGGGVVTADEMIAQLHGPEAVIPLERLPAMMAEIAEQGPLPRIFGDLGGIFEGLAELGKHQLDGIGVVTDSLSRLTELEAQRLDGMQQYLNVMQTIAESKSHGYEAIREDYRRESANDEDRRVIVEFKNQIETIISKTPDDPEEQQLIRAIANAMPKVLQRPQVRRAIEAAVKGMNA